MKPSARVALIAALAATAPTWASLPVYSPPYGYNSSTGTGYQCMILAHESSFLSELVNADGKSVYPLVHFESHVETGPLSVAWRGQVALPTLELDSTHINSFVRDINRGGEMAGRTHRSLGGTQAALWQSDGTRIDLPHISPSIPDWDPAYGLAYDMNDAGIVVGNASIFEHFLTQQRPVYWNSLHEVVELGPPFALSERVWFGEARNISPNGVIAGNVLIPAPTNPDEREEYPMRWHVDGSADLLPMTMDTGITFKRATALDALDDGTTIGNGKTLNGHDTAVLWTANGEAIELQGGIPGVSTVVRAINNNHYSVGERVPYNGAVRWSPTGEPTLLGPGLACDINDFNFVVGGSSLWTPDGDAIELESLISANWDIQRVDTITNTGWIAGVGIYWDGGHTRPFSILVPFAGTYGMGDANFDESIDFADLLIVAQNYGTETNGSFDVGDFNLDGSVNFTDLLAIAQNYGDMTGDVFGLLPNSPNPTFESDWQAARGMVPEPAMCAFLAGLVVLIRRR